MPSEGQELRDRLRAVHAQSTDGRVVRLAAALERCETSFENSIGSLMDPLVLLSPVRLGAQIVDWAYEYANDAACNEGALAREELIGTRMRDRLMALAPAGLFDACVAAFESDAPLALDGFAQLTSPDGESNRRLFDVRAITAGELLVLTWRDVTERERADAERAGLEAIVCASGDAVVSLDAQLRITGWNVGAEAVYGYSALEVLGRSSDLLIPPDATLESRTLRAKAADGGAVRRFETLRRHKDGSLIDVVITAFERFDAAGDPIGVTTITRDVTGRARALRELAASEERHREILRAIPDGV